jgi:ACS family tartrate transporter-like MFS transporter
MSDQKTLASSAPQDDDLERATMRRVAWRIMPFLTFGYFIAYIDRVNVGFAALQMNADLGLNGAQFGFAAGIFFIAYCLLEVPSNLAMVRFGARRWLARILISWGIIGIAMAFVVGPYSLYLVRFLLGAAEAGFYPGAILYLTLWFPAKYRARMIAIFGVSVPLSIFLGSPVSAASLELHGHFGLKGWQSLFILESIPAILFGFLFLAVMSDEPSKAGWLTPSQRQWLIATLKDEQDRERPVDRGLSTWSVLGNRYVLGLSLVYAGSAGATVGLGLWMPQILKSFGLSTLQTGFLNMLPFGIATVVMVWWGRASDRAGERLWRTVLPLSLAGASLVAVLLTKSLLPTLVLLSIALIGVYSIKGPFWALVSDWVPAAQAAVAIGQINALSNLTGFGATYLLGVIKDATGSYPLALLPLAALSVLAIVTVLALGRAGRTPPLLPAPSRRTPLPDSAAAAPGVQPKVNL